MGKVKVGAIVDNFGYLQQLANCTGVSGAVVKRMKPVLRECEQQNKDYYESRAKAMTELADEGAKEIPKDHPNYEKALEQEKEMREEEVEINGAPIRVPETIVGLSFAAVDNLEKAGLLVLA